MSLNCSQAVSKLKAYQKTHQDLKQQFSDFMSQFPYLPDIKTDEPFMQSPHYQILTDSPKEVFHNLYDSKQGARKQLEELKEINDSIKEERFLKLDNEAKKNHLITRCFKSRGSYQKPNPDLKIYELEFLYSRKKDSTDNTKSFSNTEMTDDLFKITISNINNGVLLDVIKKNRDIKADLAKIYDCSPEQVATTEDNPTIEQLTSGDIICYYGDIVFREVEYFDAVIFPKFVSGSIIFNKLKSIDGIILPQYIGGGLSLKSLESYGGFHLTLPEYIGGPTYLNSLTSLKQIYIPPNAILGDYLYVGRQIPEQELLNFKQKHPQINVVYKN